MKSEYLRVLFRLRWAMLRVMKANLGQCLVSFTRELILQSIYLEWFEFYKIRQLETSIVGICISNVNKMSKQLYFLLLLLVPCLCQLSNMNVTVSNSTINTLSSYTFSISKSDYADLPASATVLIIFPSQYQLTSGSYTCTVLSWPISSVSLACSVSGLVLTVSGGFPVEHPDNGVETYSFRVDQVKNPQYAQYTDVFEAVFVGAGLDIFTAQSNSGSGILITQGIMTCSMSSSPSTVNTRSIVTVNIDPLNPFPSTGKIIINSVNYWTRDITNNSKIFNISVTLQCNSVSGTLSNINCDIVESVDVQTTVSVTVTNVVAAETSNALAFSMSPVLNPPTVEPQGSFTIQTQSASGGKIDICTNVKMEGTTAGSLTSSAFSMSTVTINSMGTANITFKLSTAIVTTDTISITFPTGFTLNVTNVTVANGNRQILNPNVIGQQLSFTGISASQSTLLVVIISQIGNPPQTAATGSFAISTMRNNYYIDTLTDQLVYTASPGILTGTLSASNYQIGAPSVYTLVLTLANAISSTGSIEITFPTSFSLSSGTYSCTSTASATVACSYNNYVMTVSSVTTFGIAALGNVTIAISQVKNPMTLGTFQSLTIKTIFGTGAGTVDLMSTGLSLTLITRTLQPSNVNLTSSSQTVYSLTSFTFKISNQNPINPNSYLYIVLPSELTFGSYICTFGSVSVACQNSTYNSISAIRVSLANPSTVSAISLSNIILSNIYTPKSTKQTSTLQLYIVFNDGTLSQQLTNGLFFQATQASTFLSLSVSSNNTQNYADTLFTISFSTAFVIPNNSRLSVTFPMAAGGTCVGTSAMLSLGACISNGFTTNTSLVFTNDMQSATLTISGMKNYLSLQQYSVTVALFSSDGAFSISSESYPLMNTLPNIILVSSYSFSNTILKSTSELTLQFTPTVPLSSTDYILLIFPSQFSITSASCTLSAQLSCTTPSTNNIKITSTSIFSSTITATISGLTNPGISPSSSIFIQTYTSTPGSYLKDRDYSMKFTTQCVLDCRTCQSTNSSFCLSCYNDSSLVGGNTILSNGNCTSACSATFYLNSSTNTCLKCSTNCTECVNYSTCMSCPNDYYLYNGICLGTCPTGYYAQTLTKACVVCTSALHCQTCSTSLACLSCVTGYYFYSGVCLTDCPTLVSTADFINRVCQSCPTNCTQCTSPVNSLVVSCTKCKIGYLLDQQQCVLTCQTQGFVANTNGLECSPCSSICLTCSGNQLTCLSCNTTSANKYLFNNNCLSSCGGGYYNDNTSFTCKNCTSPCQTCTTSSVSSCQSCETGFYLYNNVCNTTCPTTFYPDGSVCTPCQGLCVTCTAATICTSCKTDYSLYNGGCLSSCPSGMVSLAGVCTGCATSCKTCEALTNLCSSCHLTNYLLNGTCYTTCPNTYYAGSTTCEPCVNPCLNCTSLTACTSCQAGFNLDGSSCLTICTGNRIAVNNICQNCDSQCLTCVSTTSKCTSCQNGFLFTSALNTCTVKCNTGYYSLQSLYCVTSCPTGYYISGGDCTTCPTLCTACTSISNCSACNTTSTVYFYNSMCYSACPNDAPFPKNTTCVTCSVSDCLTCSGTLCVACQTGYLLIEKTSCIGSCSSGYAYNATSLKCQVLPTNNTNTTNTTTNETTTTTSGISRLSFVPLPYFIIGVIFICVVLFSKLQHPDVKFVACVLPIISMLTFGVSVTNLLLTIFSTSPFELATYLLLGALGITLVLNLANLFLICLYLRPDPSFCSFQQQHPCGTCLTFSLSLISTFKWVMFLYSHFFQFSVCSLTLSSGDYYWKFVALLWVGLLSSACSIGAGALEALKYGYAEYLFYGGVELVLLGLMDIGLSIAAARAGQPVDTKYKDTKSMTAGMQHHELAADSRNQIDSDVSQVKEEHLQQSTPNQLNVFDITGLDMEIQQDVKKRAESAQAPLQQEMDGVPDYKSVLVYPKDPIKVENKNIGKAIHQGLFRRNAKSIFENKQKQEEQSALADAVKLYHHTMAKNMETPIDPAPGNKRPAQILVEAKPQDEQSHEDGGENAENQSPREDGMGNDGQTEGKPQRNPKNPDNQIQNVDIGHPKGSQGRLEQPRTTRLPFLSPSPALATVHHQYQQSHSGIQQDPEQLSSPKQGRQAQESKKLLEAAQKQQQKNEELQKIIFDDQQQLESAPTHISKEPTVRTQIKKLNSLGSLALIIEQEDPAAHIEEIKLDKTSPKKKPDKLNQTGGFSRQEKVNKNKFMQNSSRLTKNGQTVLSENQPSSPGKLGSLIQSPKIKAHEIEKSIDQSEQFFVKQTPKLSPPPLPPLPNQKQSLKVKIQKDRELKELQQSGIPIILSPGTKRKEDDLQSIFTVEDKDYVGTAYRTVESLPNRRLHQDKRYLDEGEDDLVKPSELFKAQKAKKKTESVSQESSLRRSGISSLSRPPAPIIRRP